MCVGESSWDSWKRTWDLWYILRYWTRMVVGLVGFHRIILCLVSQIKILYSLCLVEFDTLFECTWVIKYKNTSNWAGLSILFTHQYGLWRVGDEGIISPIIDFMQNWALKKKKRFANRMRHLILERIKWESG